MEFDPDGTRRAGPAALMLNDDVANGVTCFV